MWYKMDDFTLHGLQDQNVNLSIPYQTDDSYRPNKIFKCEVCSKYLSSKHCLKEHNFTHTNERPYNCTLCNSCFKHASQLSLHKKTHRQEQELTWPKLTYLIAKQKPSLTSHYIPIETIELPAVISEDQVWSLPDVVSSYFKIQL